MTTKHEWLEAILDVPDSDLKSAGIKRSQLNSFCLAFTRRGDYDTGENYSQSIIAVCKLAGIDRTRAGVKIQDFLVSYGLLTLVNVNAKTNVKTYSLTLVNVTDIDTDVGMQVTDVGMQVTDVGMQVTDVGQRHNITIYNSKELKEQDAASRQTKETLVTKEQIPSFGNEIEADAAKTGLGDEKTNAAACWLTGDQHVWVAMARPYGGKTMFCGCGEER